MASINYITGASGFLGSHLVEGLTKSLDKDFKIISIPHQEISTTILDPFDNLYFLSAYGNMFDQTDQQQTIQANLLDLIHIMNQARYFNFKSLVYISTSSVLLPVQTLYSKTKKMAENVLMKYVDKFDMPISIIRPFSITGVGEQRRHLIPTLIRSCFEHELINFVPYPRHDFIDVKDMVKGIIYLSKNQKKGIFEMGNEKSYSNQEVLELVQKCTGRQANINIVKSLRPYDNEDWKATKSQWVKKIKPISLEETITNMVRDYEQKKKNT